VQEWKKGRLTHPWKKDIHSCVYTPASENRFRDSYGWKAGYHSVAHRKEHILATTPTEALGTDSIPRLIIRLTVPAIIAQLINVLYNMVDRIYIGHIPGIGASALTGVGITFPIITIISAFSAFVGYGGSPLAAIALGKGDRPKAESILGNGVFMLLVFSILLTIGFSMYKIPLLYLFGASGQTITYASDYIGIYVLGTVFVQFTLGLNMFISSQGHARTAMLSVVIGAIANCIFDPILIFVFGLGVKGAAIATVMAQALSAVWVMCFLASSKSAIRLRLPDLKPDLRIIGRIAFLGVSPFIMSATESAVLIVFNSGLQKYGGDLYVGTLTIMNSVKLLITTPVQGFTHGVQPLYSYNYGARKFDRVRKTFSITLIGTVAATTAGFLVCAFFPTFFARLFTSKTELIDLVGRYLPVYIGAMWLFGIQMCCQAAFVGLGQSGFSLFGALMRKVVLLIPLALILPRFFPVQSIYFAEPVSDAISATLVGLLFLFTRNRILTDKAVQKIN